MSDRRQVTVHVEGSTYEEWRAIAEREYDGIEDLVRTAVRRGVDGAHDGEGEEPLTFSELLETLHDPYE